MTPLITTAIYQASTASTTAVMKTIHVCAQTPVDNDFNFTIITGGADVAANRLFDAYTVNAYVWWKSGSWEEAATATSWLGYKAGASGCNLTIGGYIYS